MAESVIHALRVEGITAVLHSSCTDDSGRVVVQVSVEGDTHRVPQALGPLHTYRFLRSHVDSKEILEVVAPSEDDIWHDCLKRARETRAPRLLSFVILCTFACAIGHLTHIFTTTNEL